MNAASSVLTLAAGLLVSILLVTPPARAEYRTVILKNPEIPVTIFNVTFHTGSADDPPGLEGLASLTGNLLRQGGVKKWKSQPLRNREQIEEWLFPLAAQIHVSTSKEQTSIEATVAAHDAEAVFPLLAQMILAPALDANELERLRGEALDSLRTQYPREDQEELGKAALERAIYSPGHPYSHVVTGTVKGVLAVQPAAVQGFHRQHFTRKRVVVGAAGVISPALEKQLRTVFDALPAGSSERPIVPARSLPPGRRLTLVKGPFTATGIHLGHPIPVLRNDPEFPELFLGVMAFGKHRSFVGRLMNRVREVRGLNYGTYAYVEDFPGGGYLLAPPTQAARSRQAFTLWARPTPNANGCFLLRQVLREVASLRDQGLSAGEFELSRSHLVGSAPLMASSLEKRLGYAIDSVFYGIKGDYLRTLQSRAKRVTLEKVRAELKKRIDPDRLEIVAVTPEPERLKEQILSPRCGITYPAGIQVSPETQAEDELISVFPVGVKPDAITIVEADSVFAE